MDYCKIVAILRCGRLESVEKRLEKQGVKGLTVTQVKGFGEYTNFFSRDWMCTHARIEIFTGRSSADAIVRTILDASRTGNAGDGLVAILPVENVYRVRTGNAARPDDL